MIQLDELDTAVVELDAAQRIRAANAAAEECLGASRERLLGQPLAALAGMAETLPAALDATGADHRPRRLHDCPLPGGRYDCTMRCVSDQRYLLEFHSQRWNRQQRQLQQVEVQTGLMDLLRRNLGHEIRNPLGGIRGAAQMMADELGNQELSTLAHMIMREVDRIDELIKRFWQPETQPQDFDVHRCLQEALELLASEDSALRIERDYDPSIPALRGDEAALRQLFLNLLRNALQAGARTLRIRTRIELGSALLDAAHGTVMRMDIIDDGPGVPEKLRPLLFLPMVTSRRDGTGLGLALVQQIAADHGGLVTYEPLAQGSRFTLHLPVPAQNQVAPEENAA